MSKSIKINNLASAIGSLVMNGFEVKYDACEYGEDVLIKTPKGWSAIELNCNDFNLTVAELIELAKKEIDNASKPKAVLDESSNVAFDPDAL